MANAANHVSLSSGQILFADPTLPWTPYDFPNLPSTALAIAVSGTIASGDINTLSLSNVITYASYETPPLRPDLKKSFIVDSAGNVAFDDPRVSLVSTSLAAYGVGVSGWTPASIGGAAIEASPPDSLTNAIAKLDGWLSNCLLSQPPSVTLGEVESTSLYAGIRWVNFPVYNTLQTTVPWVSGIVLMLGDPSSGDYLTLELTNPDWFPDGQFTDGLASYKTPIVRLRVFNDFFLGSASRLYSKTFMQSQCVRIIGEGGIYTLPTAGKVFAIQNPTNDTEYTTVNLYLPQIPTATPIPVRILYINKTKPEPKLFLGYTSTTTFGAPSAPSSITQTLSTPTSFTLRIVPPVYSDETHGVSSCYFSSYNVEYTATQLAVAHAGNLGFRYGQAAPTPLPSFLGGYAGSTFTRSAIFEGGVQDIVVSGSGGNQVLPGLQWSTSAYATNSAYLVGSTLAGPTPVVSAYPTVVAASISSTQILGTNPWVANSNASTHAYLNYDNGWNLGANLSTSAVFLFSTQLMNYTVGGIRFNDPTYPGCRSNVTQATVFQDVDGSPQGISLTKVSVGNNFTLNTTQSAIVDNNYLSSFLVESQVALPSQRYYYNTTLSGGRYVSTISTDCQRLEFQQTNTVITGYNDPILQETLSTPSYAFLTDRAKFYGNAGATFTSTATSTLQISGIYTPSIGSEFVFDIYGSNFVYTVSQNSNIGAAQLFLGSDPLTELTNYTSSVRIFDGASEVTTLPFPVDTLLHLSACSVILSEGGYQDPADPMDLKVKTIPTPANPAEPRALQETNLGSFVFLDTVSARLFSTFTNINTSNGLRVLSLLPRYEDPGTPNNMNDGVDTNGIYSNGLDTSISSFLVLSSVNFLTVSTSVVYNHTSSLQTTYTDPYSRELLFTNGGFTHPGGLNFAQFNGTPIGLPSAVFPNFTTDLQSDVNYGNRYASFLFNSYCNAAPSSFQFATIHVRNVSALSTMINDRTVNYAFPDSITPDSNLEYTKVRMHLKILGGTNNGVYSNYESAWINCLKGIDYGIFDPLTYDMGGLFGVSTAGADVFYKIQIERQFYTSLYPLIRIGISRDGSAEGLPAGSDYTPIAFEGVNVIISDE